MLASGSCHMYQLNGGKQITFFDFFVLVVVIKLGFIYRTGPADLEQWNGGQLEEQVVFDWKSKWYSIERYKLHSC